MTTYFYFNKLIYIKMYLQVNLAVKIGSFRNGEHPR